MKKTEEERKKELAILKATNEMLEQCREKTLLKGHKEEANLIMKAAGEVTDRLKTLGVTEKELNDLTYNEPSPEEVEKYKKRCEKKGIDPDSLYNSSSISTVENSTSQLSSIETNERIIVDNLSNYSSDMTDNLSDDIQYDVLPLPSNGEVYSHKKNRLPVSFLTASDENFITSPNLYRDGKIIDVLLRRKIMDNSIDPNTLCKGDRDAIVLWLRATGYGPEFPITVHDPELDIEYETVIDLTKIENKPFNLKGDENGLFDYNTKSGHLIKFHFLNHYDEIKLIELSREDNLNIKRFRIKRITDELKQELKNDRVLSSSDKGKILSSANTIESWYNNIKTNSKDEHEKSVTNTMEISINSVDGNDDREYIKKYINSMPSREAFDFRKYIQSNEPGMNFEITIDRPENLGGGSFKTFLSIDTSIFINIA